MDYAYGFLRRRLAKHLKQLRGGQPLRPFSKRLGVSYTTLQRLEMAEQNVSITTIEKLCRALKCDIFDLFPRSKR